LEYYHWTHPHDPWLTKSAVDILALKLKASDIGFEWGCGRSTIWFGKRICHLTSIEHDADWYEQVKENLDKLKIDNVDLYLKDTRGEAQSEYVRAIPDKELDFVLVDGRLRPQCIAAALKVIKPGGLLIVDNSERYFRKQTDSQIALIDSLSEENKGIMKTLLAWRFLWTTNGIWDTTIFIKPFEGV
jgi:predicted O-methyltransferase YrrM